MRHAPRRPLPRLAYLAAALALAPFPGEAEASPAAAGAIRSTVEYSTTGSIAADRVAGSPVVRFQGVGDGFVTTAAPFRSGEIPVTIPLGSGAGAALGSFVATTPAADGLTIYSHTPFTISVHLKSVDGVAPAAGRGDVTVRGWLDGTLAGASPSGVTAHYALAGDHGVPWEPRDSVASFRTGLATQTLTIPGVSTPLALPSYGERATVVSAMLVASSPLPSPAPEPGALAVLLAGAGAAALASGRRGARRRRGAEGSDPRPVGPASPPDC